MIHIIAAAVLILPAALVIVVTLPVVALISMPALYLLLYRPPPTPRRHMSSSSSKAAPSSVGVQLPPPRQRRAIITGGSSGIGFCIAQECVRRGFAQVIILARNVDKLAAAKLALEETAMAAGALTSAGGENKSSSSSSNVTTVIESISVNVTDSQALVRVAQQIFAPKSSIKNSSKNKTGKQQDDDDDESSSSSSSASTNTTDDNTQCLSNYLFCCAGETHPTYFENLTCDQFATICATNQLGSIYTVHAMLPFMKKQPQQQTNGGGGGGGAIVFCSSMAGQVGVFGYTAYSPTKFAIRGFAEALHMELSCPSSSPSSSCAQCPIHVCVAYPPDTETPCYVQENLTKPMETHLISADGGLCQPQHVARIMVDQVTERCNPPFAISFNFDGWMLSCLTAGFSPVTGLFDAVAQVAASAVFRLVSLFYLQYWWYTLRQYRSNSHSQRKESVNEVKEDSASNVTTTSSTATTQTTEKQTTEKSSSSQNEKKTLHGKSS